ncbi:MAG TPA: hypothetical protein PLP93_00440 [Nitrosomonas sp.]|nr:hypothetical protein [Nitrosomonas sp.]HRB31620.1 hypothetical protein [Nitrosomonas sp.]HRB44540.1 hypothetical protein [Nitrosomonas sp.]HRB76615.1 hypothetical protein [Nitrosomonas sp.]
MAKFVYVVFIADVFCQIHRWLANQPTWFYSTQIVFPVKPGRFKLISQQGAPMNVLQELGG